MAFSELGGDATTLGNNTVTVKGFSGNLFPTGSLSANQLLVGTGSQQFGYSLLPGNCSSANSALSFNNSNQAFGCNSFVSSVGLTGPGGIFSISNSPITTSGNISETVNGTATGIPYFSATNTLSSSVALTSGNLVKSSASGPVSATALEGTAGFVPSENVDLQQNALVIEVGNNASTATVLNELVILTTVGTGSTATVAATSSTNGVEGICVGNCTTSGNAQVAVKGVVACIFDGATTAGDYVQASTSAGNGGKCHDAGASYPANSQVLGRVVSSHALGGTYLMLLYPMPGLTTTGNGIRVQLSNATTSTSNDIVTYDGNGNTQDSGKPLSSIGTILYAFCNGVFGSSANTYYLSPAANGTSQCTASGGTELPMPVAGTAKLLNVTMSAAAHSQITVALFKNSSSTGSLTCNIAVNATGCTDLTDTNSFGAGDTWSIRATVAGSETAKDVKATFFIAQ
jgi:hypothetical protein